MVTRAANGARSVAWADVDGDADLLSASRLDDKIAWYKSSAGDGSAWTTHTVPTTAKGATSVKVEPTVLTGEHKTTLFAPFIFMGAGYSVNSVVSIRARRSY